MKRRQVLAFLALAAAAPLVACDPNGDASGVAEIIMRFSLADGPRELDPQLASSAIDRQLVSTLFTGLLRLDEAGKLAPGMAESWTQSDDGLRYLFRLRAATWSNETPVTARDFVAGFRRLFERSIVQPLQPLLAPIANAEAIAKRQMGAARLGMRAIDADILEIELDYPMPGFLSLLADPVTAPIPLSVVRRHKANWTQPKHIVTNGPFRLIERTEAALVLQRFDKYAAPRSAFASRLEFRWPDDSTNLVTDLVENVVQIADSDAVRVTPQTLATFARTDLLAGYTGLLFNARAKMLEDTRVRRALSMSLDVEALIEEAFPGARPQPRVGIFQVAPPWTAWTPEQRALETMRLLTEAGFSQQSPLTLSLALPRATASERLANGLAARWAELPIKLTAESRSRAMHAVHLAGGRFELALWTWEPGLDFGEAMLLPFLSQAKSANVSGYSNAEVDDLFLQAIRAVNPDMRADLLKRAEAIIVDEAPIAPLHRALRTMLVSPSVVGWVTNPSGRHALDALSLEPGRN
jgi:oligopeptide transport system substrate-binding protein